MKKVFLLTLSIILALGLSMVSSPPALAEDAPDIEWVRQFGTASSEDTRGVSAYSSGVYVIGTTQGTFPGQTSVGGRDAFIRKYDASGTELWTHQFGTTGSDIVYGVCADSSGVYVVGTTQGTFPGQTSAGGGDAFIRKYDTGGIELWTHQFGTASYDYAVGISADSSGVYVSGRTSGTFPGQTSAGGTDAFVRKYDASGTELWTRQFGTASSEDAWGVCTDSSGVYVVGYTGGTFPGQTSAGGTDTFVRKYDASGNELWTRQFGTTSNDYAVGISADSSGVHVVGYTGGTFPDQTNAGSYDAFIRKYDASGNELWTRQFGTTSYDGAVGISADSSGVYVSGYTGGTFPGQTSAGYWDAFVRKYDAGGNELWTCQFGTTLNDYAMGVAADSSGVYVAGYTQGTFPGQTSAGSLDAFVVNFSTNVPPKPTEVWVNDNWTCQEDVDPFDDTLIWHYDAFDKIQDGIDAVEGSIVHVLAGTYYENITLKDGVQVLGAGASVTFINGGGSDSVVTANNVDSSTKLDGFSITNGSANYGGGMLNYNHSSPTVTNCTFSGNSAENSGGGMCNYNNSSPVVTNCTFYGNTVTWSGGGMCNWDNSSPTVTNCTFYGNSAFGGREMYNNSSSPTVTNCIFWNHSYEILNSGASAPVFTYCDVQGGYGDPADNNIDAYPMFVDPSAADFRLQLGSPCIDAGDNTAVPSWLTTDFEGDTRILDGDGNTTATVDMGADEVLPPGEATQDLMSGVGALDLPDGIESSLVSKLESAIKSLGRGQENEAENQLNAFINQVEAQRGKKISDEEADELIEVAQRIIDSIWPSITVTSPNGIVWWYLGSTQTISWTSVGGCGGTVKIELSRDGGDTWNTIARNALNDGTYTWTVTGAITNSAMVKVSSVSDPSISDVSDFYFFIEEPTEPSPNMYSCAGVKILVTLASDDTPVAECVTDANGEFSFYFMPEDWLERNISFTLYITPPSARTYKLASTESNIITVHCRLSDDGWYHGILMWIQLRASGSKGGFAVGGFSPA